MHINFEFKARCKDFTAQEQLVLQEQPRFVGVDRQIDTYFNVHSGRLKLREGNIENALIHYLRTNTVGAKQSDVTLYRHNPDPSLKEALAKALGIKVVVDKTRKIYFIDNIKFHFDEVKDLGTFIEVEAIDYDGTRGVDQLKAQCQFWSDRFGINSDDFIAESYSDLLLAKKSSIVGSSI